MLQDYYQLDTGSQEYSSCSSTAELQLRQNYKPLIKNIFKPNFTQTPAVPPKVLLLYHVMLHFKASYTPRAKLVHLSTGMFTFSSLHVSHNYIIEEMCLYTHAHTHTHSGSYRTTTEALLVFFFCKPENIL